MINWMPLLVLLAEGEAEQPPAGGGGMQFWIIFGVPLAFFLLTQVLFGRNDNKQQVQQEEFIATLKKNDPVVTIGGIYGTFVSVSEDKSEVTIKVDDSSRLKMQASAIRAVPSKEEESKSEN